MKVCQGIDKNYIPSSYIDTFLGYDYIPDITMLLQQSQD